MASISKRIVSGKPRYDVTYKQPDGRRRMKTFLKRVDADRFAATVEADVLRGTYLDPDAGRVTFKKYAEEWLAIQTFESTTRAAVELRLRLHVYPALGSKMIGQIRPTTVQTWLKAMPVKSASYRSVIFANVSAILNAAVADERIAKNPCVSPVVKRPRPATRKVKPWTVERVASVAEHLPSRWAIALELGAGLGLRQGEIFGLSPADVDFLRGTVSVRRQVRVMPGNQLTFAPPKARRSDDEARTVPLPGNVRDALAAYLVAHPAQSVTLPWRDVDGEPRSIDLILTTRERKAVNRNYWNGAVWKKALTAAGVEPSRVNGMHALRHHYASVLLEDGVSIKAVSDYLGHADPAFTLRTYTHLLPSSRDRAREAIEAAYATREALRLARISAPEAVTQSDDSQMSLG